MNQAETGAATLPETLIKAPRHWGWPSGRELWEYRDLLYFLTKRELQIRYKQSFFGISWALLQPLVLAFIFALVFGAFIHTPTDGLPTAVFMVAGIVPWLFFSQAVMLGANSLVLDADLISKVYFPRIAIPVAKGLSLIIDLVIAFAVVIAVGLIYGEPISSNIWLVPGFVALGLVTTFALSSLAAAVNVKYRDVQLVMPMLVQVMFFITPVLYPASKIQGDWQYLYALNPMSSVLEGIRWAIFDTTAPGPTEVAISAGAALVLLLVSLSYFQRTEHYFADFV
ncbi:MAG: ABC transporter permease [Solirubrobacterales bacterium]|nr:ABC transporter permease [Solirubrobacterales bacterium]